MKKAVFVCTLALASSASAVKWEYAFLTDSEYGMAWTLPTQNTVIKSGLIKDLLPKLNCKGTDIHDLFNCVGAQGWEFVQTEKLFNDSTDRTYIFKRLKS